MSEESTDEKKKRAFDTYDLVVDDITELTPNNRSVRFAIQDGKTMSFQAGQFVQVFVPQEGKPRRTSYSLASSPAMTDAFELCVTHVEGGVSSSFIHNLKVGDRLQGMGPLGRFTMADETRDTVFICTGSGVAPFRSMILDRLGKNTPQKLYLLFGNRYEPDIIYQSEWASLAKAHTQFTPYFTLSRADWDGPKGYVQDHIEKFITDVQGKKFYICGLKNMINAVEEKLLSLGVAKEHIHFERYD